MNSKPLNIAILTISDTRDMANDTSGSYLESAVKADGHQIFERQMCPDDIYRIRAIVSTWIVHGDVDVIITTGGTGVTGRDITPEAIAPLFDKAIDGFGELFRYLSFTEIGTSTIQSRAIAGVANATYIFVLPGSSGACRTAWQSILAAQLNSNHGPCNFAELIFRLNE